VRYLHNNGNQVVEWKDVGPESFPNTPQNMGYSQEIRDFFQTLRNGSTELMIIFGSGASLDWNKGHEGPFAPSTTDLWDLAEKTIGLEIEELCEKTGVSKAEKDIEKLLSQIDHILAVERGASKEKLKFQVIKIENAVRNACDFLKNNQAPVAHIKLFEWITEVPRSNKYPRIYTTNYDLCLENAASLVGYSVIDGFSFGPQRRFAERYLHYGFNSSGSIGNEPNMAAAHPIVGIFKLHGSVNWIRVLDRTIIARNMDDLNISRSTGIGDPVFGIIAPRSQKIEKETSPYFELNKRFVLDINQFKGTLFIIGFGFRDNDLTQVIQNSIFTDNGRIQNIVIVSPSLEERKDSIGLKFLDAAKHNDQRIWLFSATFEEFSKLLGTFRNPLTRDALGWPVDW